MTTKIATTFALLAIVTVPSFAGDVWFVSGLGATLTGPCQGVRWRPETILHNRTDNEVTLRVLHVSNGGEASTTPGLLQPRTSEPARLVGVAGSANAGLWVTRIDAPDDIDVEGRLEYYTDSICPRGVPPNPIPSGKLRLPVFKRLIPPNKEQTHYGTDLGGQEVRVNVAIYNAGLQPAHVGITVYQPRCASAASVTRTETIPADAISQISLGTIAPCTILTPDVGWISYVVVTVDQPSFSFISTLQNGARPAVSTAVSE